ncbi:4-phosphoerythronate dehydrogenase [Gammaproteobacteria bacterium]|nr:4-phosphoerythronate dehydrogenase [Gammaproteobacteria bacterium]
MRILADQNIPSIADAFGDLGEVILMPGRDIRAQHLRDCQCLITRTVTRVDEALLGESAVEFVGSATIGTDHLDIDYLRKANIAYSNAAGCNAEGAAEYVVSGLFELSQRRNFNPLQLKAGIVGFGNVGSRLYAKLDALGIDCLVCDPPLQQYGRSEQSFVALDTILGECNFISLHVPLLPGGDHPTFHLLEATRLRGLVDHCVLVNAARGEVVDNAALLELLQRRGDLSVHLDTWENEPQVSRQLLQRVDLATPHIAGYSVEGRLRGAQMVLDAACAHFRQDSSWHMSRELPAVRSIDCAQFGSGVEFWRNLFQCHFDIRRDHHDFVAGASLASDAFPAHFDGLRRLFPDRLEYDRFQLHNLPPEAPLMTLQRLGFHSDADAPNGTR